MSQGILNKPKELPEDVSTRLKEIINRHTEGIIEEVAKMFRFANMDEGPAAVELLKERGHPMPIDEVVAELMAGGMSRNVTGAKGSSAAGEIRRSLSQTARHGVNLKYVDRENEIIGLPGEEP